jgi:hypothetical protein
MNEQPDRSRKEPTDVDGPDDEPYRDGGTVSDSDPFPDDGDFDGGDHAVLEAVRGLCEAADPVPPQLYTRVRFALELGSFETLLATVCEGFESMVAVRGAEHVRTITFECGQLTIAITITPTGHNRSRVDGYLAPAGAMLVELRSGELRAQALSDDCGRFAFDDVGCGELQLVALPTPGSAVQLERAVLTAPIVL